MGNVLWKMSAAGERGEGDLVSSELPSDWVWCVLWGVTSQARGSQHKGCVSWRRTGRDLTLMMVGSSVTRASDEREMG